MYKLKNINDTLKTLQKIEKASIVMLDRWQIDVIEDKTTDPCEVGDPIPYNIINNYFSVGVVSRTYQELLFFLQKV